MLKLRFFVIVAFAALAVIMLVGCGDNLDPIVSGDSNPLVKVEVQALVLAEAKPDFVLGKIAGEECYEVWFLVSVSNLGNKEITIDGSSFIMNDVKGAVIYSQEEVFVFDSTSVESSIGTAMKYLLNSDNEITFVIKPKSTELVGLFTVVPLEPIGEWNLVYGNRQVVISVQKEIEQAIASGKKTLDEPSSGGKDSTGNVGNQSKEITSPDGAPMVLIPAGEFQMGRDRVVTQDGVMGWENQAPAHTVYLDAFYMDKYEVTNAQYRKFVQATGHKEPEGASLLFGKYIKPWHEGMLSNDDNQPVICVSWEDANAYAKWAGKRLPTEAEWEKAARGGLGGKKYVWGDEWPPLSGAGNFADETLPREYPERHWDIIHDYDDGYAFTAPVGKFRPNGYGLYDMAGNVCEYCADWYSENYYAISPAKNPKGPDSGEGRILRGDHYYFSCEASLLVADRVGISPTSGRDFTGFRCAMDATK